MRDALWYACGILIAAVAFWLCLRAVSRAIRRRFRRWAAAAVGGIVAQSAESVFRWLATQPFTNAGWWLFQRQRHRMWRAVSGASRAVAQAQATGAAVGDLPRLASDLRRAASDLDQVLVAMAGSSGDSRGSSPDRSRHAVQQDLAALMEAARGIHDTALLALQDQAAPSLSALTSAVRIESEAFRAGLASARESMRSPA